VKNDCYYLFVCLFIYLFLPGKVQEFSGLGQLALTHPVSYPVVFGTAKDWIQEWISAREVLGRRENSYFFSSLFGMPRALANSPVPVLHRLFLSFN